MGEDNDNLDNDGRDGDQDNEANRDERDALQDDRLILDRNVVAAAANGPDAEPQQRWCFNMVRLRQNGNYDFFCLHNVKKGQIIMVIISIVLLICLVLYALF